MGDVEFNMLTIVTALLCYVNKCQLINILYSEMKDFISHTANILTITIASIVHFRNMIDFNLTT